MMNQNDTAPKFTDEQLLAYLDGVADPYVAARIEGSPPDRKRAQDLARMQSRLTSRFYRLECPESESLGEYLLGYLSRRQSRALKAHLQECPHCTRELVQLREFMGPAAQENRTSVQERIRILVAGLVSGLGATGFAPAFALRGQEEGVSIYEVEGVRIALEVRADRDQPGQKVVMGLITGAPDISLEVEVRSGEARIAAGEVDALGNFAIKGLLPGTYDIIITGPAQIIQIPTFVIK